MTGSPRRSKDLAANVEFVAARLAAVPGALEASRQARELSSLRVHVSELKGMTRWGSPLRAPIKGLLSQNSQGLKVAAEALRPFGERPGGDSHLAVLLRDDLATLGAADLSRLSADELRRVGVAVAQARAGLGATDPAQAAPPDLRGPLLEFTEALDDLAASPEGKRLGLQPMGRMQKGVCQMIAEECTPENPLRLTKTVVGTRAEGLSLVTAYAQFADVLRQQGVEMPGAAQIEALAVQAKAYHAAIVHNEVVARTAEFASILDRLDRDIAVGIQHHQAQTQAILSAEHPETGRSIERGPEL